MEINRYLDHAILNPEFTMDEVKRSIEEAIHYEVQTVCERVRYPISSKNV